MEIAVLSLIAAVFCLDITSFGQIMISRPIVCAPVFGYLLGDIKTGLWIGMILELLWVNAIPMGAAIPQDATPMAILAVIWSQKAFPGQSGAAMLALVLAVPAGVLFKLLDIRTRYYNIVIAHWVEAGVEQGSEARVGYGVYAGMALFFAKAFLFFAVLIWPGTLLLNAVYPVTPRGIVHGLEFGWRLLPAVGLGLMLTNFRVGKLPFAK